MAVSQSPPRGEAAAELARLIDSRGELEAKLDALDREQRVADEEVARLSAELTKLEQRALEGEQISNAQRGKAEAELVKARAAAAAPWGERRQALRQAIGTHKDRVQGFVAAHLAELVEEVERDGVEAAQTIDRGAEMLIEGARKRDDARRRLDELNATVRGQSRFGDVTLSRAEPLVAAAQRFIEQGGEAPPVLRVLRVGPADEPAEQTIPLEEPSA
jgi:hypothetical protein